MDAKRKLTVNVTNMISVYILPLFAIAAFAGSALFVSSLITVSYIHIIKRSFIILLQRPGSVRVQFYS